jgi:hypothetical protein
MRMRDTKHVVAHHPPTPSAPTPLTSTRPTLIPSIPPLLSTTTITVVTSLVILMMKKVF